VTCVLSIHPSPRARYKSTSDVKRLSDIASGKWKVNGSNRAKVNRVPGRWYAVPDCRNPPVHGYHGRPVHRVGKALGDAGIKPVFGLFLDFLDPGGNRVEIVGYTNIQFTKAPNLLRGMGLAHLSKNATAIKELTDKGMAPLPPSICFLTSSLELDTAATRLITAW
jgi:hypothetical protein